MMMSPILRGQRRAPLSPGTPTSVHSPSGAATSATRKKFTKQAEQSTMRGSSSYPTSPPGFVRHPPPPLPSQSDRKRFLGCLASILASSYPYDDGTLHDDDDDESDSDEEELDDLNVSSEMDDDDDGTSTNDTASLSHSSRSSSSRGFPTKKTLIAANKKKLKKKKSSSSFSLSKRAQEAELAALTRHRQRRFEVSVQFLTIASQLLMEDENAAEAFVPLLQQPLLVFPRLKKKKRAPVVVPAALSPTTSFCSSSSWDVREEDDEDDIEDKFGLTTKSGLSPQSTTATSATASSTPTSTSTSDDDNTTNNLSAPQKESRRRRHLRRHTLHSEPMESYLVRAKQQRKRQQLSKRRSASLSPPPNTRQIRVDHDEIRDDRSDSGLTIKTTSSEENENESRDIGSHMTTPANENPAEEEDCLEKPDEEQEEQDVAQAAVTTSKSGRPPPPPSHGEGWYKPEVVVPFLDNMTPGAALSCLVVLMLRLLMLPPTPSGDGGYDARVRHALKKLAVVLLVHEEEGDHDGEGTDHDDDEDDARVARATRKFEVLERHLARRLLHLAASEERCQTFSDEGQPMEAEPVHAMWKASDETNKSNVPASKFLSRDTVVRGLKVGGVSVVAGTILAVTGGLAAPAIAAAVGTMAAGTALAGSATVAGLTSTAAVTTLFGLSGGGLAAHKMGRRTKGLSEFSIEPKERPGTGRARLSSNEEDEDSNNGSRKDAAVAAVAAADTAELFSTVCVSGWIRNAGTDFERPWGVDPAKGLSRRERLERFFLLYEPNKVYKVSDYLREYRGREGKLWQFLRETYGNGVVDPDNVMPFSDGPYYQAQLNHKEIRTVDNMMYAMQLLDMPLVPADIDDNNDDEEDETPKTAPRRRRLLRNPFQRKKKPRNTSIRADKHVTDNGPKDQSAKKAVSCVGMQREPPRLEQAIVPSASLSEKSLEQDKTDQVASTKGATVDSVWDYHANFGGELYTVRWESKTLVAWYKSFSNFAYGTVGQKATMEILEKTVLAGLVTAIAIPAALWSAAGVIDGPWTLAVERADAAGVELARALLLQESVGRKPVSLVGCSMGARVVYSCLLELERKQALWEVQQERLRCGLPPATSEEEEHILREPASVVEDAILLGTPVRIAKKGWAACRRIVAGRLVHCYSTKDWLLWLMFHLRNRSTADAAAHRPIAATSPIALPGVENVDVTDLIRSHSDYASKSGTILRRIVKHGQPHKTQLYVSPSKEDDY